MCYYNSVHIKTASHLDFLGTNAALNRALFNRAWQNGFEYKDWPVILPTGTGSWEIKNIHWEYIPEFVYDHEELKQSRIRQTWLNAKAENLFVNEKGGRSMWRDGALNGRCLALSTGFFEHRHIPMIGKKGQPLKATEKVPYFITLKDNPGELFFIAAISRTWTNKTKNQSALTMAYVTAPANPLMQQVHNSAMRMPTILPKELAEEWLQPNLSEQRILEIAKYQYPADKMIAWPVAKFVRTELAADPVQEVQYPNLPPLVVAA